MGAYLTWIDCREPEYKFHENRRQADAEVRRHISSVGTYTASMDVLKVETDGSTTLVSRALYGDIADI